MMSFQDARRSNLGDEAKEVRNYFLQQLVRLKSVNIYLPYLPLKSVITAEKSSALVENNSNSYISLS